MFSLSNTVFRVDGIFTKNFLSNSSFSSFVNSSNERSSKGTGDGVRDIMSRLLSASEMPNVSCIEKKGGRGTQRAVFECKSREYLGTVVQISRVYNIEVY